MIATICSLTSNIIGAGSQVKFHYETKQVKLTKLFVTLSLITHIAWMLYGISIGSIFMIITQTVGGTLSFTIFVQRFFAYPSMGIYKHYKGKEYELIGTAKHSETSEELAVYKALYGEGEVFVRPLKMFKEEIEVGGKKVRRFELVK